MLPKFFLLVSYRPLARLSREFDFRLFALVVANKKSQAASIRCNNVLASIRSFRPSGKAPAASWEIIISVCVADSFTPSHRLRAQLV